MSPRSGIWPKVRSLDDSRAGDLSARPSIGRSGFGVVCAAAFLFLSMSGCTRLTEAMDDSRVMPATEEILLADNGNVAASPGGMQRRPTDPGSAGMTNFEGSLRGDGTEPTGALGSAGGARSEFGTAQVVDLNFTNTPIPEFLDRVLRGAMGVNYVAPGQLPGVVNFRTTTPVPRDRLLPIVRDVLALNGLTIRELNGVQYIGPPALLQQLATMVQTSSSVDARLRVIPVPGANAKKVGDFIRPLLPPETAIIPAPGQGVLYVMANPAELAQIEALVRTVSESSLGNDIVRIVPLSRSEPEQIAAEIRQLYTERGETDFSVIPLANRQALMISSSDKGLLAGIVKLVMRLDTSVRSSVEVRVIQLKTIPARVAADQLSAVFSAKASSTGRPGGRFSSGQDAGPQGGQGDGAASAGNRPVLRATPSAPRMTTDSEGSLVAEPSPPRFSLFDPRRSDSRGASGSGGGGSGPGSGGNAGGGREPERSAPVAVMASDNLTITADERNNSLLVYSDFMTFQKIRDILEAIDIPQAQVAIEATVLEVELNDSLQYGVSWFIQNNILDAARTSIYAGSGPRFAPGPGGATSLPSGDGPGGAITVSGVMNGVPVKAVIQALQAVTNVKIISTPYLTVVDGQEARLQIGQEVPFASATNTNQFGQTTQTVQVKNTGIILQVRPKINGDNSVNLSVTQEVSQADRNVNTGTLTPTINTRRITSDVLAFSGGTVALGGLIQNRMNRTTSGVPIVSKVPVVGDLFKQTTDSVTKTELMILLTPRVLRTSGEISQITHKLRREMTLR